MSGQGFLGYGVTCGAIETFSRILAGELGPSGVRVICLRPDAIPEALNEPAPKSRPCWQRARALARCETLPKLAEVANFAAFLASDRASAMTGVIVNLACGSLVD